MEHNKREKIMAYVSQYAIITLSITIMSVGVYFFKFPNNFVFGGVTGAAALVAKLTPLSAAAFSSGANMILLVVVVSPVPDQKDPEIGTGAGQEETETEGGEATEQQYERLLEKRVEDTLECVEGVGKVKVMITLKSSEEKVVEKDSQREENEITEEDSKGGSRVSEDRSLSHTSIYEQKSDGTQTPYVSKEMVPEIEGMVIAADGGDDPVVVKNLTEAVQALFGVEAHKIKIMKRTNA